MGKNGREAIVNKYNWSIEEKNFQNYIKNYENSYGNRSQTPIY